MASADLRDELTCSVCLNIFTDPVTLSCGHSFCRVCITKAWDKGEKKEYVCAECKQRFKRRPQLHRNLKLSKIAERFQSPHKEQKDIGIACTYCIHAPMPAVKSCLLCEASLCEKHLNIHSKSVEHILMEPITSFENRKCSVHKEILKYYCSKDAVSICVSCRLDGEHKGHQVESLEQASEKKNKKLRNILENLTSESKKAEKRVQSLMVRKEEVHKETDIIKELLNNIILDMKGRLENLEKEVLSDISKQEKQLHLQISEQIQKLEIEKEELSKKMSHIEGLCNVTDPVTVLRQQELDSKYGCDAKKGKDQGREKDYFKLPGLENPDLWLNTSRLFTGLASILLTVKRWDEALLASDYYRRENMYSGKLLKADTELDSIKDIQITDDILLDINTASNETLVSSDLRTVLFTNKHQGRTETPKRFHHCPQVFSMKSFSSGQHYWEVETAKQAHIRVGVAYPSIDRKGHDSMIGTNSKSWCLERVDVQYIAINNNEGILLPHCASGNVIGIYLDYDAGRLSFYERSNSVKHLHTFTVTFKEPLHLLFWVLDQFIKIRSLKH